jgi:hypothetical protein
MNDRLAQIGVDPIVLQGEKVARVYAESYGNAQVCEPSSLFRSPSTTACFPPLSECLAFG